MMTSAEQTICFKSDRDECVDKEKRDAGVGIAIGGLVSLAVGLPLLIIGAQKVPIKKDAPDEASFVPTFIPTSDGGALRWLF